MGCFARRLLTGGCWMECRSFLSLLYVPRWVPHREKLCKDDNREETVEMTGSVPMEEWRRDTR